MEYKASIDAAYEVVERVERQRKRLTLIVIGISISSLLGLAINAFAFMVYSHQKGALDNIYILQVAILSLICLVLAGLAIRKFVALRRLNEKLKHIGELEETIYNEVLKIRSDQT